MNLKKIYKLNSNQIYKFGIWLGLSISYLFSEGANTDLNEVSNFIQPQIIPSSAFVFDPFPRHPEALVLPYDSIPRHKGILKYYFGIKKTDIELFSGEFWSGRKAKDLGLIDEVGDTNQILIEKYGEDVVIKKFEKSKSWLSKKLSSSNDHVDQLANILDEKSVWQRYGL